MAVGDGRDPGLEATAGLSARVDAWLPEEWSRRALREQLQAIAEAVAEMAGFGVVAIGVVHDTQELELLAVAGHERVRADLLGDTAPAAATYEMLARAEHWGPLRFVPHEAALAWVDDVWLDPAIEPESDPTAGAEAWRPYDVLMAPVTAPDGSLVGVLSFDQPADGLRPGPQARERVAPYIGRAAAAILAAIERDRLAEHVRMTDTLRRVLRTVTMRMPTEQLLPEVAESLRAGFGVDLARITTLQTPFTPSRTVTAPPVLDEAPGSQRGLLVELAQRCWAARRVALISEHRSSPGLLSAEEHRRLLERTRERGLGSLALLPLGVGSACLGWALLGRVDTSLEWNDQEAEAALAIGHDLGRAVLQAQRVEQDRALTEELRAASEAKTRLIATVAHELKNPLGAILGYAELLGEGDHGPAFATSLAGLERSATRLRRMVDELLVLSRLEEHTPTLEAVDLRDAVSAAVEHHAALATERDVEVLVDLPEAAPEVAGSATDLQHLADVLLENAVTYSEPGSRVRISVAVEGEEVLLVCADHGIGIPADELDRIFTEFYRTTNPAALAQPGTGLGLAIAGRVARAHGARIDVDSTLGRGSTFRVRFPRRR